MAGESSGENGKRVEGGDTVLMEMSSAWPKLAIFARAGSN